ncbi:hypothetical protein BEP19_14135 [Ammoniphilus oxalaticus]|uniref:Nudix hydrolase domain-containing protein n=2 Tax=Ammoniphilus oxalaticus TaxID=66863 RepID=A0A419SF33_9BACL|nr:hypothetical protein BEP19_14135 [Ammoniphilus oxalaticus]
MYENRAPSVMGLDTVSKAAVMVPLVKQNGELGVLFQVRGRNLRFQPGEICFPGGRMEPNDLSEESAAIRETCEELGIHADEMVMIGPLDILVTTHSIIYPFLCQLKDGAPLHPHPDEVEEVFIAPLSHLLEYEPEVYHVPIEVSPPADFPFELIPNGKYYKWRKANMAEYFYRYQDYVIWGLTARILHVFIEQIRGQHIGLE